MLGFRMSVAQLCTEYGVQKQVVSDNRKAKQKLLNFVLKFCVEGSSGVKAGTHMKVAKI